MDAPEPSTGLELQPGGIVTLTEVREVENLVILGAGPAGLTAAIYAARANLQPLLISKDSGQLSKTGEVENYPSCEAAPTGSDVVASFWRQARQYGARSLIADVEHVNFVGNDDAERGRPHTAALRGGRAVSFRAMIVASGTTTRRLLGTPGEDKYYGNGVAGCATCEGWFFRGRDVVVIGGGDTAMEEALFLSRICRKVTLVHRRHTFKASRVMQDRVLAHPSLTILLNTTVEEFMGNGEQLTHVALSNHWTESDDLLEVQGAFVAIGYNPNSAPVRGGPLELDEDGYIRTHSGTRTNLESVFAAGDVADRVYRQAITSAGTGAMAAMDAERHLCRLGC